MTRDDRRRLAGHPAAPADLARRRPRSAPSTRRADGPPALVASLGAPEPGRVAIDLAEVDARPADAASTDGLLALETRDGGAAALSAALASIPAYWLIGRRYRRR